MRLDRFKRGIPVNKRVLVTGDTGFLGHHIIKELNKQYPKAELVRPFGKRFFDLTRQQQVEHMFEMLKKEAYTEEVWNLAGLSANEQHIKHQSIQHYYQNLMIGLNVLETAVMYKVRRLIRLMDLVEEPNGYLTGAEAYSKQTGIEVVTIRTPIVIGEQCNLHPAEARFVPSLIMKFLEANKEGYGTVTIPGTGKEELDIMYAGDLAYVAVAISQNYKNPAPVNVSTGRYTPVVELAETIKELTEYTGKIHFERATELTAYQGIINAPRMYDIVGREFDFVSVAEALEYTIKWIEKKLS